MSTLPGVASKGEKGKSKFQSLDINNLYKVYTTEPLETQQQKNTLPRKHGMQSLGKVPTARRPPANLPSLKSEHTGSDAAVSLVPSGGAGWGKQEPTSPSTSTPPSSSTTTTTNATSNAPPSNVVQPPAPPVNPIPPVAPIPPPNKNHAPPTATAVAVDKSWSAVMSGSDILPPPPYQSPQFQHEFPSLSAGDGVPQRTGSDTQYGPGPSLRPQTEGSWIQGGLRTPTEPPPRASSAPLGPPPQLSGPAGPPPQQPLPINFRGLIPPFMCRGNFAPNGHVGPNFGNIPGNNGRNRGTDNRGARATSEEVCHRPIIREEDLNRMDDMTRDVGWATHDDIDYNQKLAFSDDDGEFEKGYHHQQQQHQQQQHQQQQHHLQQQQMSLQKEQDKTDNNTQEAQAKNNWNASKTGSNNSNTNNQQSSAPQGNRNSSNEEDEVWVQRRRQHNEELNIVIVRAKQRKEEEEKRFLETKQAAAKKLQQLEEKINRTKHDKDVDDTQGTINPSSIPAQPITPVPIPVPDWEREKDDRSRTPVENCGSNNKAHMPQYHGGENTSEFRKLAQIEGRNFVRKETRSVDRDPRDRERDQNGPSFSRQFQSNLPPRFQKQQQLRNHPSSTSQPQSSAGSTVPFVEQYDARWQQQKQTFNKGSSNSIRKTKQESVDDCESQEDRRVTDETYRGSYRSYDAPKSEEGGRDYRNQEFDYRRDDKWEKEKPEKRNSQQDLFDEHGMTRHNEDRREKYEERFERPQRPDSRDSRTSRESRHSRESEPREYHGSWADAPYEPKFDDRRKDHFKEDRSRAVPGPITKERIEAEDLKSEKKNLTQLKRGFAVPEKKAADMSKKDESEKSGEDGWGEQKSEVSSNAELGAPKAWADAISPNTVAPENPKFMDGLEKNKCADLFKNDEGKQDTDTNKSEKDVSDKNDKRLTLNHRRVDQRQQGWGSGNGGCVYHRSSWSKKNDTRRGGSRTGKKLKSGEWHGTDSDVSVDEMSVSTESGKDERSTRLLQRSPKPSRKYDKDEKNRDAKQSGSSKFDSSNRRENYVPRGEPSRHGRGASSNFRSRGGLSKRIDGYGPPPSKSPFGPHDEKDKKNDEVVIDNFTAEEKTKQNQQALSAGIIGTKKIEEKSRVPKKSTDITNDTCDTSDNSDENKDSKLNKYGSKSSINSNRSNTSNASMLRRSNNNNGNPPPRFSNDKRSGGYAMRNENTRQHSTGSLKSYIKKDGVKTDDKSNDFMTSLCPPAIEKLQNKNELEPEIEGEEKIACDSDGFQEVKSKKMGQRLKTGEDIKPSIKSTKLEKDKMERKKSNGSTPQLTPQQIANIPSLMDTPINPPLVVPPQLTTNKSQFDRSRQNKLPPRFAKQRENNRLQKAQLQQGICEINDMNKVNHGINMYNLKDGAGRITNAWEKPLSAQLRTEQETILNVGIDNACKSLDQSTSQNNSPNIDKAIKSNPLPEKTVLDGTTPPVNTIIFENTNFKSAPGSRPIRTDKSKMDEGVLDQGVMSNFNKPIRDLLNKNDKQAEIQMQLTFGKEDSADMKLDFFETEISHLTDDKSSKNMARSIHAITTSGSNTISPSTADALNFKIASVKKVWEMPTVNEHSVVGQEDPNSFSASFGPDPNSLDPSGAFGKGGETPDDNHESYNSSPNQPTFNNTTNVCKVKPTQQVPGTTGQVVHAAAHQQQHSTVVGPGIVGHPLSPPPMQPVIGASVGLGQPPQPYTSNQHLSYQASLGGSTQYGMSAIPSPPTVLFNSTQQIQAAQTGLYGAFQIDQSQVLGNQARSQYSQYPNPYNLGQTASSPYSPQSMYLQSAQHPSAAQPPPDIYQNLNNYRLPGTGPFGQNQQLNNPTTVLISSTSNSLMSATVKPSTQQISAIGTKAGGATQAYQAQSQQGQQLYMAYDPSMQANYLPNTGVMQRGPTAGLQNNVVPTLQPSSSYYTGSTGGQTGFYQQPGNSTLSSAPLQQHQAGYGLQGNVFGTNQTHTNAGLQNFSSHFLSSSMQMAAAAALNAQQQQYRSTNLQSSPYVKGVSNHVGDQSTRPQQIKSPGSQQDVLSSVFNSGPQIPSPKSRPNIKQPPPQPSPTAQHKYLYQNVGSQQSVQTRYPNPIQRPVTFQPTLGGSMQNNPSNNQKHRASNQGSKLGGRNYYGGQGGNLSAPQNDKPEDAKLGDCANSNSANGTNKANSSTPAGVTQTADAVKETAKDETAGVVKD